MAKYTLHYVVRRVVEFESEEFTLEDLAVHARWLAKNHSGDQRAKVVQVLPAGVESTLLDDQPPEPQGPTRPLPPPPMPPLGAGGDQMLARAA